MATVATGSASAKLEVEPHAAGRLLANTGRVLAWAQATEYTSRTGNAFNLLDALGELPAAAQTRLRELLESLAGHDQRTFCHCLRVGARSLLIARQLGLSSTEVKKAGLAGLLHDLGKLDVPTEILTDRGKLSAAARRTMNHHAAATQRRLRDIDFGPEYADLPVLAATHHEHLDGSGYPHHSHGDAIPMIARIVGAVDTFDAIVCKRSYKPNVPLCEALRVLRSLSGVTLDSRVVEAIAERASR